MLKGEISNSLKFTFSMCSTTSRDQAYKNIETQLSVSVAVVKANIVNLRSQLGREIRSKCNKTKSGQSAVKFTSQVFCFYVL